MIRVWRIPGYLGNAAAQRRTRPPASSEKLRERNMVAYLSKHRSFLIPMETSIRSATLFSRTGRGNSSTCSARISAPRFSTQYR
jgi:hypothetical protein